MEQINREELERATKRIMEMNSKARLAVNRNRVEPKPSGEAQGKHEKQDGVKPKTADNARKNSIFDVINFKGMAGDSDRTLLAGIMLLLGADAADEKLMLALLYIML